MIAHKNPIQAYLDSKNINYTNFANACKIHPNYVYALINKTKRPSIDLIKRISEYTNNNVTIEMLVNFYTE